jgi:hypothetical protein
VDPDGREEIVQRSDRLIGAEDVRENNVVRMYGRDMCQKKDHKKPEQIDRNEYDFFP